MRQGRAGLIAVSSLPEFAVGGLVPNLKGGMLAIVHPGEFVMRKSAVEALGSDFLGTLNRAPRFAAGGQVSPMTGQRQASPRPVNVTFVTTALDGPSVDAWWKRNQGNIVRVIRRAVSDRTL